MIITIIEFFLFKFKAIFIIITVKNNNSEKIFNTIKVNQVKSSQKQNLLQSNKKNN